MDFAPRTPSSQNKLVTVAFVVAALILAGVIAFALYIWFSGGSGDASGEISAPALIVDADDTRTLFSIAPEESEARFLIDELLLGSPKTVVGATHEIAGEMLVDFDNPANSQLGVIRINVRTLKTDNEFRNRALRGQILQAEQYEFAQFTPTSMSGLPSQLEVGEAITFQITGDLTVHGVTREVTFETTLTPVTRERLEGIASTTVSYRDFGIAIPEASGVADISETVKLEIDLVAVTLNQ